MKALSNGALAASVMAWGMTVCAAFWHYEWRYLRPVARPAGASDPAKVNRDRPPVRVIQTLSGPAPLTVPGTATLVNFWNASCACSRSNEAHVAGLIRSYQERGARFITVIECSSSAEEQQSALKDWQERGLPAHAVALDPGGRLARAFGVWAAPAAVVVNRAGLIVYIGGYNAGRFCHAEQTAWAAQALQAAVENRAPDSTSAPFYGCQVVPGGS